MKVRKKGELKYFGKEEQTEEKEKEREEKERKKAKEYKEFVNTTVKKTQKLMVVIKSMKGEETECY